MRVHDFRRFRVILNDNRRKPANFALAKLKGSSYRAGVYRKDEGVAYHDSARNRHVDGERIVEPETGGPYLDREASFNYKIEKGDLCYSLFIEHGFEWGGDWTDRKDYQHFEVPDSRIAEWYPENA